MDDDEVQRHCPMCAGAHFTVHYDSDTIVRCAQPGCPWWGFVPDLNRGRTSHV